ncbi:MAG: GAF domain-containing protein [Mariniphaga sp.]
MNTETEKRIDENTAYLRAIMESMLRLVNFSISYSLDELLEEILNEAEMLTGSSIAFVHFIDENQEHLMLQNWSKRTKAEFCKAVGKGSHYPISQAGVWVDCIKQRKPVIHNDYASLPHCKGLPEGHAIVIRELVVPVFQSERIVAVLGVGNKITDYHQQDVETLNLLANLAWEIAGRKRTEEALRDSEAHFHKIFDTSPVGMVLTTFDFKIIQVNPAFCKFLGYSETELKEFTIKDITHPDDFNSDINGIKKLLSAESDVYKTEKRYISKDNEVEWGNLNVTVIKNSLGEFMYLLAMIENITSKKVSEKILRESEARLRELNATKDKFFSIISHDLKSPFSAIMGFSELLSIQMDEKDYEGIEEYAKIIKDSSQRAMSLLTNLLLWARSQTSGMNFQPEYVELVSLINGIVELANDSAKQKSIKISKTMPHNMIGFVDKEMIGTILRNLISNAIKFTNDNGAILVEAHKNSKEISVSVSDNGVGIPGKTIEKLFCLDQNLSTKGTKNETGTGLGLILCKEFVEKHGGKIYAESEIGLGSKFTFTVPNI